MLALRYTIADALLLSKDMIYLCELYTQLISMDILADFVDIYR